MVKTYLNSKVFINFAIGYAYSCIIICLFNSIIKKWYLFRLSNKTCL